MTTLDLLIFILACWRIAYLVTKEDAPFRIMRRIRARTTLGGLLTCLKCASLWTAALVLLLSQHPIGKVAVVIFAISGGALMLSTYSGASYEKTG